MTEFELFQAALEIADPAARQQFLERSCARDAGLRHRVDGLLASHESQSEFLTVPVVEQLAEIADSSSKPTIAREDASTGDDDRAAGTNHFQRSASTSPSCEDSNDEIALGYLEPSSRSDSLGRMGHYEVLEVVGRGAFGTVLRAFDEKLHRVVAIKVMAPELATTSPARKRFLREAQASAAIRHENVVAIHAVEEKPLPYLVMEFVPGGTLQQRLDERGPLDIPSVLRLGGQIAAGLAAAHAIHLIHRDIKPGNILLDAAMPERVKITDFGLARTADDASLTQSGTIAGTPMYMAPEQALGKRLDQRADLFSLGSVLYQMLSGRPPFRAANTVAVLKRVVDDAPRPIEEIIPEVPQWMCNIVARLLEKDPENRFQTAQEVADRLGQCETELQSSGVVSSTGEAPARSGHRTLSSPPAAFHTTKASGGTQPAARPQEKTRVSTGWVVLVTVLVSIFAFNQRLAWLFDKTVPGLPASAVVGGLRFDGRDDYVEVTGLRWDYPQFTLEAFVTSAADSDHGTLVSLSRGTGADAESMTLFDGPQTDPGNRISGASIRGKTPYENAYGPLSANVRQHRALVFDGRYLNYYINGVWQGKRFAEPHEGLPWKMTAVHLGCDCDRRRFFQGVMDQVRISRVARYSDSFTPMTHLTSDAPTLALYDFEGGQGETLTDVSGHGHHGVIHGATWVTPGGPVLPSGSVDPPRPAVAPFTTDEARAHQAAWARHLGVPVNYTNSIGMKFVLIPPGEFLMGSTREEMDEAFEVAGDDETWKEHIRSEGPQHRVVLTGPVYLGAHEVTQAQYRTIVGGHVPYFSDRGIAALLVHGQETGEHPVEMITWNEAVAFCEVLSRIERREYRLPSEAVWEFACRAGTTSRYWSGDGAKSLPKAAWFKANAEGRTHAVGELKANPFGLYDTHGNVWEWVRDRWDTAYYGEFAENAAIDPPGTPAQAASLHVLRGGDWNGVESSCRSSHRHADIATARFGSIGFRVMLAVDSIETETP